jgi:hypothetical protein
MNLFECYECFESVKLHFKTDSYDYFKYNGKLTRLDPAKFENGKEKLYFRKIHSKYPSSQIPFLFAVILKENPSMWIGNIQNEDLLKSYLVKRGIKESLTHHFKEDMIKIKSLLGGEKFVSLIKSSGEHPRLFTLFRQGTIKEETLGIINGIFPLFDVWKKTVSDPIVLPNEMRKIQKFFPFLEVKDLSIYGDIIQSLVM